MSIGKIDTKGEWMVNGSHIYIPSKSIRIERTNVAGSDTGRTEDGVMHIDWVRTDLVKVYMTWGALTPQELSAMLRLMQGKEFDFTYKDVTGIRKIRAYCGESNYTFYSDAVQGGIYKDISINVIQV